MRDDLEKLNGLHEEFLQLGPIDEPTQGRILICSGQR